LKRYPRVRVHGARFVWLKCSAHPYDDVLTTII
jgi:hypothetical protein